MPARLARLKLDTNRPGFYDDPKFLAAERGDPTLLEAYARFVDARPLSDGYVGYARARVAETTSFLFAELKADGRKGACIDMSVAVSRFLEMQGVWNYIVTGATTVTFPASSRQSPKHFYPMGSGSFTPGASAAHAWVCVPPFAVVDLTIAMQPYENLEQRWLPDTVIAENPTPGIAELNDLVDPEGREELRRALRREPTLQDIQIINVGVLERTKWLGVWVHNYESTQIRYIGCAVSAPDAPMANAKNLKLRGRYMIELWREFETRFRPPGASPVA